MCSSSSIAWPARHDCTIMAVIEIDKDSGFCFGVVNAIAKAEAELDSSGSLYCLGDIVHNSDEVDRLCARGLKTITHADLEKLHDVKVLLRAHGEPPETYETARRNNIKIIDATCPVVLRLQRRIRRRYEEYEESADGGRVFIYGKLGHAEVNGLVGQTHGTATVIQDEADLDAADLSGHVSLYSQTTKSIDGFESIVRSIEARKPDGQFEHFDTICRQVATRMAKLRTFAAAHEAVIFVCGAKSSNGRVLYEGCRAVNPHTYMVSSPTGIDPAWVEGVERIGICGATSTPSWLMNKVKAHIEKLIEGNA